MKRNYRALLSFASLGIMLFATALSAEAQGMKYKVGDRVEVDVILQSNPATSSYGKATIIEVDASDKAYVVALDPLPGRLPQKMHIPVRDYGAHWIRDIAGADNAPKLLTDKLRVDENNTVLADRELLDCDNLKRNGRNGSPPPVELAKKLIRCLWEKPSPPGQDGANTIDITEFTIGAPHRWRLYIDVGEGNAGTLVYPAHVKWNQKTFYRSSNVLTTDREATFTCFADTTNIWQCGLAAGPNKDGKKQEIVVKQ